MVPRIADYDGYRGLVSSSNSPEVEEGTEAKLPRRGKVRNTPLYSIIKHYPTKWQRELHRAAVSAGTFKDFDDTTVATE
jgi:hypothetical protein